MPTARQRPPMCARTCWLADPPDDVRRDAVWGGLLADVLLLAHAAPRLDVDPCGGVVGRDRDRVPDADPGDGLGQLDDRPGAGHAAAVELHPAHRGAPASARRRWTTPGSSPASRCTTAESVSRPSETRTLPCVSAPIAASTWLGSRLLAVHAEPLATPKPSRSSSVTSASPSR